MEEVGEVSLLPKRRLTCREKLRRWYARYFFDILENIFMFWIGMMIVLGVCLLLEVLK